MTGQIYYGLCGSTGDAYAPQTRRGVRARYLHVFLICGAIILIWARLNQMSDLQNYKIALLAGTVSGVNFSLISLPPEEIWFSSVVFYLPLPDSFHQGGDLRFNSV